MIDTGGIDVFLGLDIGKDEHHATANEPGKGITNTTTSNHAPDLPAQKGTQAELATLPHYTNV
ncbi:hypothetical protein G3I19_13900 [Streptomyces sp. SID10853]|uniref:hypothetical protein n=1 Tax=Streptomyces sp. SID10853 TaxID=2706028 RepID=UPI0013C1E286|nr:hypothetical protein [Streptomyces sp. SID10853]NDZ79585.1 hypothetical protein [Streptomyces sp. SID10853]